MQAALWVLLLTITVLVVHGFHPAAEDGGIYTAGIYLRLHPGLFPHDADFVRAPMAYSSFAWMLAKCVQVLRVPVAWVVLTGYLFTVALTLWAVQRLSYACGYHREVQFTATALLAAWWTLPVAGTSLTIGDPYLTARSFTMPLSLFAISFALERWRDPQGKWLWRPIVKCVACLLVAAWMHLLMFGFAAVFVVLLRAKLSQHGWTALFVLGACSFAIALTISLSAPAESAVFLHAELTRQYWFLSEWRWYEACGLLAPLLILDLGTRRAQGSGANHLFLTCLFAGVLSFLVALVFARQGSASHLIARLQPLRMFILLYVVMTINIAAWLVRIASTLAQPSRPYFIRAVVLSLPAVAITFIALCMFFVQLQNYSSSRHVEVPWHAAHEINPWAAAFLWCRQNTAENSLFSIDAAYIHQPAEDAQTFRAIAWRSVLADQSKDGGEAAVNPELAQAWETGFQAQTELNKMTDTERRSRLQPLHVDWIVLPASARTSLSCPYNNLTVKVCRLDAAS